ncbi:hypothetical protein MKW98_000468 [Papaver atlanticum]|uniref:Leucine-rich repeat-containing N-terminal plant-type domain-containing protein n=1 Tax=Papaver atlanticum TaxID=357466 RepID=A0AAD4S4K6_9MAGN|nr:hypothetical protein MKW98_000468 [Papaver atlanticum]
MAFIANRKTSSFLVLICFLTLSLHATTTEACHRTDRKALLDFKSKITQDSFRLLETWNQSTDCCIKWEGIACDSNGRVVNLSRNGISTDEENPFDLTMEGTISPSLGKLKFLRVLDLRFLKDLAGTIPSELGKLYHLTSLLLDINRLNGSIPASFQNLRKLNRLLLGQNLLSGMVPTNIFQHMSSLTELDLSINQLSGALPSSIDKLVSLKRLDLSLNKFSGSIPYTIGFLENLDYLDMSKNQISGIIPTSTGELSKLTVLHLNKNSLSGSIPSFSKLVVLEVCVISTRLQALLIDNNRLSGKLPDSFGKLTKLIRLSAKNNRLTGKIPASLGNLINLQILDLSRNRLSGPVPSELAKLNTMLETLDLSFNPLSLVTVPNWISKMNLQALHLAGTGLFTLDVSSNRLVGKLPAWIAKMRNLHTLNVSNNGFHSDIPIEFKNLVRCLGVLDLHRNNFTGGLSTIFAVSGRFRYTFIDVSYNMFAGPMAVLQTLVLSKNRLGGGIPKSLGKLSFLKTLKLDKNEFTGTIPAELSSISFTTSIVLSHNKLTSSIPSGVMNLLDLVEFDVSYNKLTGKIPLHKRTFPASSFAGNSGLCDSPLPPCKTA